MNPLAFATLLAGSLFATGTALAADPINPLPSSCAIDEVYKCEQIGGQTYCKCAKRALTAPTPKNAQPRRLKGKPQHLINHGVGATAPAESKPTR
jgi:hypothetical protein